MMLACNRKANVMPNDDKDSHPDYIVLDGQNANRRGLESGGRPRILQVNRLRGA